MPDFAAIAGGVGGSLDKLVAQRLFEQMQAEKIAEMRANQQAEQQRIGQAGRGLDLELKRNELQSENNAISRQIRQDTLDATKKNQENLDADRDEQRFQGKLRLLPKGARLSPTDVGEFAKRGYSGLTTPIPNEPALAFAGTQDTENKENALEARGQHQQVMEALAAGRLSVAEAMAKIAETRASWGPAPIQIQTVDPSGNAVTRVMPRGQASGQDFQAQPTAEQRNRQAASGRAAPVLQAISELSERINTGQGAMAKIAGGVERQKAQVNLNDDISEYDGVVSGFTPLLARAVGHTGVLTEQDVQSVRKMLPQPGDSKSVRDRKIARIQSLMGDLDGGGAAAGTKPNAPAADPLGIRR
jgi:hypothetical protein